MKRFVAGLITAIVMTLMACTALLRSRSPQGGGQLTEANSILQDPRSQNTGQFKGATACIEGLLASARAGDVDTYLRSFAGPLRDRLTREADEIGRDAFARRLRDASLARKSHAVFAPSPTATGPTRPGSRLSRRSPTGSSARRSVSSMQRAHWIVTDIETAREHVPKTSFGSLATYQEPEGAPVAARPDEAAGDETDELVTRRYNVRRLIPPPVPTGRFSDREEFTMRYRLIAVGLSLLAIVGVSVTLAQVPATQPAARALDPEVVAVRLILGIGDATPEDWTGRVVLDKGEVVDIEGVRFREGDAVTGRDGWKTQSRLIRKATAKKAAAKKATAKKAAAKKAAAKAGQQATTNVGAGPGTTGPTVTPNGVILTLKNVAGATLTVDTHQGRFTIPINRLADGAPISLLDDRVSAQRVFPHAPLFEGPMHQDFPAAAADPQGAGAWVAAVWHEPRGPELLPADHRTTQELRRVAPNGWR